MRVAIDHPFSNVEESICFFGFDGFKLLTQLVYRGRLPADQLNANLLGCFASEPGSLSTVAVIRVVQDQHPIKSRENLPKNFETFCCEIRGRILNSRESPAGLRKTLHKSAHNGSTPYSKNDRSFRSGVLHGYHGRRGNRIDQVHFVALERLRRLLDYLWVTFGLADLKRYFLPVFESQFP